MAFEEEFDLEIPDEDAEKIATVGDAIQLHQGELSRGAGTRGRVDTRRVVITGVGAVTPIGNTAEEFWTALLAGAVGHRAHHPVRRHRLSHPHRGRGEGLRPAHATSTRRTTASSTRSSSTRWPARSWRWRTPALDTGQGGRHRFGVLVGSGIGGITTLLDTHKTLLDEGARPRLALLHPDADRQHGLRPDLDALRRQGAELLGGDRVRHRQPRDRRRHPDHPARRRRRDDRGRRRGHHHPAHHRGLLPDEGDVHAQRRARPRPRGPFDADARRLRVRGGRRPRGAGVARARAARATRGSTPRSSATA